MTERRLTITLPPDATPTTVGHALRQLGGVSAGVLKRAKEYPDGILLGNQPVFTNRPVAAGDLVSVLLSDRQAGDLVPARGDFTLVHEDDDLLVVDKPAGVAVHPSPGHYDDTLGNFMTLYFKERGIPFVFRPVNRLDCNTSGLMVVARHAHSHEVLKNQLHTGDFCRTYLAVCLGGTLPDAGVVDAPIGRAPDCVLRRQVREDGRQAVTRYQVQLRRDDRTLVKLTLETGRTHQIRVHMAHLGAPLAGDFLYGVEDLALIPRTALHAHTVSLAHPMTGAALFYESPLPGDMAALLKNIY